jgi:hypothetical protein
LQYKWKERKSALPLGACHPVGKQERDSSTFPGIQHGMTVLIPDVMDCYVLLNPTKKISLASVCTKYIKLNPTM